MALWVLKIPILQNAGAQDARAYPITTSCSFQVPLIQPSLGSPVHIFLASCEPSNIDLHLSMQGGREQGSLSSCVHQDLVVCRLICARSLDPCGPVSLATLSVVFLIPLFHQSGAGRHRGRFIKANSSRREPLSGHQEPWDLHPWQQVRTWQPGTVPLAQPGAGPGQGQP